MDSIDRSLAEISRKVSVAEHNTPSAASGEFEDDDLDLCHRRLQSESSEQDATTSGQAEGFSGIHHDFPNRDSNRHHTPTSALCLIQSSRRSLKKILGTSPFKGNGQVTALLASNDPLGTALRDLCDSFAFAERGPEPDFSCDNKPVSGPPPSFIRIVIASFLSNVNIARPVFQESRLRLAIERHISAQVDEVTERVKSLL